MVIGSSIHIFSAISIIPDPKKVMPEDTGEGPAPALNSAVPDCPQFITEPNLFTGPLRIKISKETPDKSLTAFKSEPCGTKLLHAASTKVPLAMISSLSA